jgi:hypothetical protein
MAESAASKAVERIRDIGVMAILIGAKTAPYDLSMDYWQESWTGRGQYEDAK